MKQGVAMALIVLLVALPAVGGLLTQAQFDVAQPTPSIDGENAVGNAIGVVAVTTAGVAMMTTAMFTKQAMAATETATKGITPSLVIERVYAVKNTTETTQALRVALHHIGDRPVETFRSELVGSIVERAEHTDFATCQQPGRGETCITSPNPNTNAVIDQGERVTALIPVSVGPREELRVTVEANGYKDTVLVETPPVLQTRYTRLY
jgi:archaellin